MEEGKFMYTAGLEPLQDHFCWVGSIDRLIRYVHITGQEYGGSYI